MDIEVAPILLTDRPGYEGPSNVEATWGRDTPWAERAKVVVNAEPDRQLKEIVGEAIRKLDLQRLRLPNDEGVEDLEFRSNHLFPAAANGETDFVELSAVLEVDGTINWWFVDPTIGQVVAAKNDEIFNGDPTRLAFVVDHRRILGGNGLDYWLEVLRSLPYLQDFLMANQLLVAGASTVIGAKRLIRKAKDLWSEKGGDLEKYDQLFRIPRTTSQVARHLGIAEDDVATLMHMFGLDLIDGRWRPVNRPERKELRELVLVVDKLSHWHLGAELRSRAISEVLTFPAGERARNADSIIRRVQFDASEVEDSEVYVSENFDNPGWFDLIDFSKSDSRPVGTIKPTDDGRWSLLSAKGSPVLKDQQPILFDGIDDAVRFFKKN